MKRRKKLAEIYFLPLRTKDSKGLTTRRVKKNHFRIAWHIIFFLKSARFAK